MRTNWYAVEYHFIVSNYEALVCWLTLFSGVSHPSFGRNFIFMHSLVVMIGSVLTIIFDTLVIAVTLSNAMETLRQMRGFKIFQTNSLTQVLVKQGEQYHSHSFLWLIIIKVLYGTCMFCIPVVGWGKNWYLVRFVLTITLSVTILRKVSLVVLFYQIGWVMVLTDLKSESISTHKCCEIKLIFW